MSGRKESFQRWSLVRAEKPGASQAWEVLEAGNLPGGASGPQCPAWNKHVLIE